MCKYLKVKIIFFKLIGVIKTVGRAKILKKAVHVYEILAWPTVYRNSL